MGKIIKQEKQVLLHHLSEFLAEEAEELDNTGIELIFGKLDTPKSNEVRLTSKVMATATSTTPKYHPRPSNYPPPPNSGRPLLHSRRPCMPRPPPCTILDLHHIINQDTILP